MPGRRRLVVAGVATFLLGLPVLFPARVAWHWIAPQGIALAGIEGSIWRGGATEASVHGFYLRDLQWRWLPSALTGGRIGYALKAIPGTGFLDAELGVAPAGVLHVADLRASVPLPQLETALGIRGLEGTANIDLPRLLIRGGLPVMAEGNIEVSSLVVPYIAPTTLGRYRVEIQTQDGSIVAAVLDDGGVVDLTARLQINSDRAYDFLGYVAPTADTPPPLLRQMQLLGSPGAEGRYELRFSGRY
jgi:general secretion pathway protein N